MGGAARERGEEDKICGHASRSDHRAVPTFSKGGNCANRLSGAWTARGENGGETDNRGIIAKRWALRAEKAKLSAMRIMRL